MADDRPPRYIEDGMVVYRASGLGACMKSLVLLGLGSTGTDWPEWMLKKFQEGIDGEPVVIDMLRSHWNMVDETAHQYQWHDGQLLIEVKVGTRVIIRGHADGVGTCYKAPVYNSEWTAGEQRLIEVKCTTEDYGHVVLRELPVLYQVQITTYAEYFGLPAMLALGIKDENGEVVNVVTQMVDPLPMTMAQVKQRVMELESCIGSGDIPDCDYRQYPCPYYWLCDEPVNGKPGTPDDELLGTLEESIRMVRQRKGIPQ